MSIENRINGREKLGRLFSHKDVIENGEFALKVVEENLNRGKIFAVNHFSLFDGPSVVGNLCRLEPLRAVEMGLPVTDYLYKYAEWLDRKFGLDLRMTGVVTPANVERSISDPDKAGAALRRHMQVAIEILRMNGAEVVFPQATRVKEGLGEPGPKNRAMEGLLRLSEKIDPVVIPVGIYAEKIPPRYLYWANPFPYHIKFGEPKTAKQIKSDANLVKISEGDESPRPFDGADAIVYGMIRTLLPENYR